MPLSKTDAQKLIARRHPAWGEFQERWRWLADSLEGGERYRHADYASCPFALDAPAPWYATIRGTVDPATGESSIPYGTVVRRNLVPHLSEMSPHGSDLYCQRLHRTPVPMLVEWVTRRYLSRVYARQVTRTLPAQLGPWADDVDGEGTDLGCWLRKTVGPLLLALGQLDLVFGHPPAPEGETIATKADAARLGTDRCVASYVLPENMAWWRLNPDGSYRECLVFERPESGGCLWRHWTAAESNAYDDEGNWVEAESFEHGFGRVPIVRVFDHKKTRVKHVGQSRLETLAELQKSVYNRKSELVLSDILQSHAILQGPEEFVQASGKITLGPGGILPKKASPDQSSHEGWDYLDTPKSGAAEIRTHVQDEMDEAVMYASLLKPAGTTFGSTVSQSGISKAYDYTEQNDVLCEVAETLGEAEEAACRMALVVLTDGAASPADLDAVEVEYPAEFGLFDGTQIAAALDAVQAAVAKAGALPGAETELIIRLLTACLPGLDEARLAELADEVRARIAAKATEMAAAAKAAATAAASAPVAPGKAAPYATPIVAQAETLMAGAPGPGSI